MTFLIQYVIYHKPRDWSDVDGAKYVLRRVAIGHNGFWVNAPICCIARTLAELQEPLDAAGLYRMPRFPDDDPVIVEVWF